MLPYHRSLSACLGLLLVLLAAILIALPGDAVAHGGGIHTELRYRPQPPIAGQPLAVALHATLGEGGAALTEGRFFVAAEGPTGERLPEIALAPTGEPGHWAGSLTLPAEGIWALLLRVEVATGGAADRFNVNVAPAGTMPSTVGGQVVLEFDPAASLPLWRRSLPALMGLAVVGGLVLLFLFMPAAQPDEAAQEPGG